MRIGVAMRLSNAVLLLSPEFLSLEMWADV
jgi:hypothetical protein